MLPTNFPVLKSILELKVRSPKSLKTLYIFTAPLEKRSSFLLKLSSLDNLSESYYSDIDFQNGKIYFQKIGKLIMCTSMIQLTEPLNSGITNVGTVPEGFRPPKTVEIAVFGSAVERQADILGNIDIQSNGSMRLFSSQTFTSVAFRITACWFI